MSKIACKVCGSPDIRMSHPGDMNRPLFTCASCGDWFTYGTDGGRVADYCREREARRKEHEPHYVDRSPQHSRSPNPTTQRHAARAGEAGIITRNMDMTDIFADLAEALAPLTEALSRIAAIAPRIIALCSLLTLRACGHTLTRHARKRLAIIATNGHPSRLRAVMRGAS